MQRSDKTTLEAFGQALDTLKDETMAKVGQEDARYIRRMIRWQRYSLILATGLILLGFNPYVWATGIVLLALSKIWDNEFV